MMSISLTVEQQHIFFQRMEVYIKLRCELCCEIEEIPMPAIHEIAVETGDYNFPIEEFKRMAVAFTNGGWRVLPHPTELSEIHKLDRKHWLEEMELKENEIRWSEPGEPVVVCELCAKILENQFSTSLTR
jgi:hypothetical protein